MRRVKILFYWLFGRKNNVSFSELLVFLSKPVVTKIAKTFIDDIKLAGDEYEISFRNIKRHLFWPKFFPIDGIYQVTTETFDKSDWHFYQKKFTEVVENETILDIGTAEGLFVLTVIDRCNRVILIEPNEHFVRALEKTFSNDMGKVVIHDVLVGEKSGEVLFNSDSLASSVTVTQGGVGAKKRMDTIDNLVADEPAITYLKADVEGFELEALKGARATIMKHKPKIAITTYHRQNNASEIIALLKGYVPAYNSYVKGVFDEGGKPVMIHLWV